MTGKIGTVKVNVTTTNYENFQLKLVLNAVDQIKPEPDGTITATPITYGDTLSKSEISGKMKDPNTGEPSTVRSHGQTARSSPRGRL